MKLRTRLSLAFAAAAMLPVIGLAPVVLGLVRETFDGELRSRLAAAVSTVAAERDRAARDVVRAASEIAASEEVQGLPVELALAADPSRQVEVAGRLMAARDLGILALLDRDGRVLSSGHLPARVGDLDPQLAELARGRPRVAVPLEVERPSERGIRRDLALVAGLPAPSGVLVAAGVVLGEAQVSRLASVSGATVELRDASGQKLAAASPEEVPVPRGLLSLLPDPGARAAEVPLGAGDASLHVSVTSASLAHLQGAIAALLAGTLLASALLAAALGSLLAGRLVRPLEALAAGAQAVSAGDLGHRVEVKAGGEVGALVESFNGMTADLLRERERAAVAERVAAWREVARRLAHEIKNPLAPIAMSIETLRDAHAAGSPEVGALVETSSRAILEEVARLKGIVDEFSRFARLPPPRLCAVDPASLVDPVLALFAAPPAGITLRREVPPGLPPVLADRDQVAQVLLNLVQNAEQALPPEGGTITVRAAALEGAVALEVADTGRGIPPELREKIFEPYFTTRESGTGLGLAIARRIAEEHGGSLEVAGPGPGATLRLTLRTAR